MLKQGENIVHRLFNRQICRARPNAHIHEARKLYENIVPNHTVYDVECPDISFRKFTNDGQYLICFSRNQRDLVVYRHKSLNSCVKGEPADEAVNLPSKSRNFESYFSHLYSLPLAAGAELICTDFFLATDNGGHGIFATFTPYNAGRPTRGAVAGVPFSEKITLSLVSLAEGRITDQRTFQDDFIHLAHNMGVFLYDDLLAVLSIRFQCIRIFQIRESGIFVDVRTLGEHCREDDELVLNSQAQEEELFKQRQPSVRKVWDVSSPYDLAEKMSNAAVNGWHPQWNAKQILSSQRGQRTKRLLERSAPRTAVQCGRPDRIYPSSSSAAANNQSIETVPLDLQYDDYFRALFASFENIATSPGDVRGSTLSTQGHSDAASNGRQDPQFTLGGLNSSMASEGMRVSSAAEIGGQFQMRHTEGSARRDFRGTPYSRIDPTASNGGLRASQSFGSSYSSGSGTHHSSSGPSRFGGPYSNGSESSSLDLSANERGSASMRNTSTTMTSSDSSSRSIGSRRSSEDVRHQDTSASERSFGNNVNGLHPDFHQRGQVMRRFNSRALAEPIERGGEMEQAISSRGATRSGGGSMSDHQVCPQEHRPSRVATSSSSERGSLGGNFRDTGHSMLAPGTIREGSSLDHHRHRLSNGQSAEQPLTIDHSLPSGPGLDRAMVLTGELGMRSSRSQGNANDSRGRVAINVEQSQRETAGRDTETTTVDPIHRNRVGVDASGSAGAGGDGQGSKHQILGGIKQRLLSFIYQHNWKVDGDPSARNHRLKRFYRFFQDYLDLLMWKVQFLDRHHLLIKFGSLDGVLQRNSDTSDQNAFLAIFNLQTTEVLGFYQNSSDEFLLQYEQFCDHFRAAPRYPVSMKFVSSCSNNSHIREQLRKQRTANGSRKAQLYPQIVKRTLAWVPFNSQCHSPSAYFDQYLFHYDEKLISATDRHKPCMEHPVKFISRRRPNSLKFKINPGPELGVGDSRTKRYASFIFHPVFPFAISVQQAIVQPQQTIVNFHLRK